LCEGAGRNADKRDRDPKQCAGEYHNKAPVFVPASTYSIGMDFRRPPIAQPSRLRDVARGGDQARLDIAQGEQEWPVG
jgi:hypothetical protein